MVILSGVRMAASRLVLGVKAIIPVIAPITVLDYLSATVCIALNYIVYNAIRCFVI